MSSILDKINEKKQQQEVEIPKPEAVKSTTPVAIDFSLDELEFLIRMIGSANFKGNDLMFIYDLVNKLQNLYLDKKGVE
tara:strand:- start:246 stop:482 length:237 start_codon:yes stop_codon:yes gene_type:complete